MSDPATTTDVDRHRALSDPSRQALLAALEAAGSALSASALAARVGLHVNTVRWHLGILLDAGLVVETRAPAGGRGRPPHRYGLAPGSGIPPGSQLLADTLVDAVAGTLSAERIEAAGRKRGRTLVAPQPPGRPARPAAAIAEVMRLLDALGFQPSLQRARGGRRIAMRPCPFGDDAAERTATVCPVHLGLIRGVLDQLGGPVEITALEPFARPHTCIARFGPARPEPPGSAGART